MGFLERIKDWQSRVAEPIHARPGPASEPVVEFTVSFGDEVSKVRVPLDVPVRPGKARQSSVDPDVCWVRAGQEVAVGGYPITAGMIYVGEQLAPAAEESSWLEVEPALIDPRLEVGSPRGGPVVAERYLLSYDQLSAGDRAGYLAWLAGGRREPDVPPEYLRLFLFGIERRLLSDAEHSASAREERNELLAELERLRQLHSEVWEFAHHATGLVEAMHAERLADGAEPLQPPRERVGWQIPLALRIGLGKLAADRCPIPVDWALSWLLCSPEAYLRTPASRCPREFEGLFRRRYTQRHGEGLRVRPLKRRITVEYRAASPGLDRWLEVKTGIPDVAESAPLAEKLRELARACSEELDAYSRWIGRNPDRVDSLPAISLLPRELLAEVQSEELVELQQWLLQVLSRGERATIDAAELLGRAGHAGAAKLPKKEAVIVIQLLEKLGYGMEPDVRFGGPTVTGASPAVLFKLPLESPEAPSPEYAAAATLLHLSAAVAVADGTVSPSEQRHLEAHLEAALNLEDAERVRLGAHLQWLLAAQPKLAGIRKRLETFRQDQREAIGQSLVRVAIADGHVSPEEIRALSKIYELLGLDTGSLYSRVHELTSSPTPDAGPVTIRPGEPRPAAYAIPQARDAGVALDRASVEEKLAESAVVASLLATIFTDDESQSPALQPSRSSSDGVAGLDAAHSAFLRVLVERTQWDRSSVETLASEHGLMTDGALELVNEAAFASCDTPIFEGDDPLDIDPAVAEEMLK